MNKRIKEVINQCVGTRRGSLSAFALAIGVKPSQVSEWVNNKTHPGSDFRRKICETFNVSRDWLDTGSGEMLVKKQAVENTATISEREIGRLEGELMACQKQLEWYNREVSAVLSKCSERLSDNKITHQEGHQEGQPRRATANTETEEPLIASGRRHR